MQVHFLSTTNEIRFCMHVFYEYTYLYWQPSPLYLKKKCSVMSNKNNTEIPFSQWIWYVILNIIKFFGSFEFSAILKILLYFMVFKNFIEFL